MQDVLPANVVWRRKKMGFPFNNKEWLLNSEHIALKHLTAIHDNPFLEIAKIVPRYRALIDTDPLALWRCISFALWWRRVVQGEPL